MPEYKYEIIKNIFKDLDRKSSLYVLGICLATNDIVSHVVKIQSHKSDEDTYYFANSLSILREIAKLIMEIDKLELKGRFSKGTCELLDKLKSELLPFNENSLVKDSLKPIRDFTYHYDFLKSDQKEKIDSILELFKTEDELKLRANIETPSILRNRFTFADKFRMDLINLFLTKDLVDKISNITVDTIAFVDSLLFDLSPAKGL